MGRLPVIVERILTAGCLGGAFLMTASILTPAPSQGEPFQPRMPLGQLEGLRYEIELIGTNDGPRYTVKAGDSVLAEQLTAAEVRDRFPAAGDPSAMDIGVVWDPDLPTY